MFRPSNPNNRHLTMLELQDWERQRDAQKTDFSFIRLSRPELRLLKESEKDWVRITDKNERSAVRLRDLDFGRIIQSANDSETEAFELRDRGRNYLMYFRGVKLQKRIEWIRYIITTVIAVIALVVAIISLALQYI